MLRITRLAVGETLGQRYAPTTIVCLCQGDKRTCHVEKTWSIAELGPDWTVPETVDGWYGYFKVRS